MKIVIIEDEELIAEELAYYIKQVNVEYEISAILPSVGEAITYLKTHVPPDAFFSDIQLSDGLSFEIFEAVNVRKPVIFCTAFDQYAIEAFKANGVDYILKPFSEKSIHLALTKFSELLIKKTYNQRELITHLHQVIQEKSDTNRSVLIRKGEQILPIKIKEIALVFIDNQITYFLTFDNQKYTIANTLDKLEKMFGNNFFRVNRQMLIQKDAVGHVSHYFARKLLVHPIIKTEEEIIVGKLKTTEFIKWLES